jgi:hypothetical protein
MESVSCHVSTNNETSIALSRHISKNESSLSFVSDLILRLLNEIISELHRDIEGTEVGVVVVIVDISAAVSDERRRTPALDPRLTS